MNATALQNTVKGSEFKVLGRGVSLMAQILRLSGVGIQNDGLWVAV